MVVAWAAARSCRVLFKAYCVAGDLSAGLFIFGLLVTAAFGTVLSGIIPGTVQGRPGYCCLLL